MTQISGLFKNKMIKDAFEAYKSAPSRVEQKNFLWNSIRDIADHDMVIECFLIRNWELQSGARLFSSVCRKRNVVCYEKIGLKHLLFIVHKMSLAYATLRL